MKTKYCVAVTFLLSLVNSRSQISVQNTPPPQNTLKKHNPVNFPVKKQFTFRSGADMKETVKYEIIQKKTSKIEDPTASKSDYFSPSMSSHTGNMNELNIALFEEPRVKQQKPKRSVDHKIYVGQNLSTIRSSQAIIARRARKVETKTTTPKENPHAALMMIFKSYEGFKKKEMKMCSGSMISGKWLLTAGHCLSKQYSFQIFTGGEDYFEYEDKRYPEGSDYVNGHLRDKLFLLPNYSENDLLHDLALLEVVIAGSYDLKTRSIELSNYLLPFDQYKSCSFTGFGRRDKGPFDTYRRRTHYMDVKSPCPCVGGTEEKDNVLLCSEPGGGHEVCDGDLGAGLVCDGELVAVASKLISKSTCKEITINKDHLCASEDAIVVFVKICPYLAWINKDGRIFRDYYGKKRTCHEPTPKPITDAVTDPLPDYDHDVTDYPNEYSTSKKRRPKNNKTQKHHHRKNNSLFVKAVLTTLYLCLTFIYIAL